VIRFQPGLLFLARPFLSTATFAGVMPTASANSATDILRRASMTSMSTMIAITRLVELAPEHRRAAQQATHDDHQQCERDPADADASADQDEPGRVVDLAHMSAQCGDEDRGDEPGDGDDIDPPERAPSKIAPRRTIESSTHKATSATSTHAIAATPSSE
jgi:hypothetical protein